MGVIEASLTIMGAPGKRSTSQCLEGDGKLGRCPVAGGKPGAIDGAYLLHLDGIPAGYIENFRDGHGPETWRANID